MQPTDKDKRLYCNEKGVLVEQHCCLDMAYAIAAPTLIEHQGENRTIDWISIWNEYRIPVAHDGYASTLLEYCPFCGTRLPESQQQQWHAELYRRGYDDPGNQQLPAEFNSDAWWRTGPGDMTHQDEREQGTASEAAERAIHSCVEEEYAPCFAVLWRCPQGWRAVPFPLRGPGSSGCLARLLGIWLFSRPPQRLVDMQSRFLGSRVSEISHFLGSYGMGGPGFLGLKMATEPEPSWLIYRLWSASEWLTLDGRIVTDTLFPEELRALPTERQASLQVLLGTRLGSYRSSDDQLQLDFTAGDGQRHGLSLRRDGQGVPVWRGTGEKKIIPPGEDLDDVIIISHKGRIWLDD